MFPKEYISHILSATLTTLAKERGVDISSVNAQVTLQQKEQFGDYSTNVAFSLAPLFSEPPTEVAAAIATALTQEKYAHLERVEVAGNGFLNFFLDDMVVAKALEKVLPPSSIPIGKGKRVIVEYSSPNVAKPMHVGHLRATVLGDFLANLYEYTGHKVVRWNHLGDWGTQFGKLIVAYKRWGKQEELQQRPIPYLLSLYVRFHEEAEQDSSLEDAAREEFKKLEQGNKENQRLLSLFQQYSLVEYEKTYSLLDIHFDVEKGESFYTPYNQRIILELQQRGIAHKSEGALVADVPGDKDPALLQKSDGSTLYLTRDLASLWYRIKKFKFHSLFRFNPDMILYVVGDEQSHYFKQFFSVASRLPWALTTTLVHVGFGLVSMLKDAEKIKLSTRKGNIVKASDITGSIIDAAFLITEQQNPDLSQEEKKRIALTVGVGATKYSFLKEKRTSTPSIDVAETVSLSGNNAPYLQYTYARVARILEKASSFSSYNSTLLDVAERALIKKALEFPAVITLSLESNSSHHVTEFLFGLANDINTFYETTPILKDENEPRRNARLTLLSHLNALLKQGLSLLGISVLERI
jgi:arginyl-tRNA synthetase